MAGVRRFDLERLAVLFGAFAVTALPMVGFWLWARNMSSLTLDPTTTLGKLTEGEADSLRTALGFDFAYIAVYATVLYVACRRITSNLVRYRWVGKWLARLALAGALADVVENVLALRLLDDRGDTSTARWLEYAAMAKWGLVAVPVVFAIGCLIAWATRISERDPGADPRSVAEAIAWAKDQPVPRIFPPSVRTRASEWVRGKRSAPVVPAPGAAEPAGRTGICFSGGGVRSAAYNLGALQELQASGELQRADYLAAVSGGSYIAGAHAITGSCSPEEALGTQPPYSPGSVEEQYLRNRTTYLFPNLSGVGVALWRLVRGLAVNIAFVAMILFIVARPYGWVMASRFEAQLRSVGGAAGRIVERTSAAADNADVIRKVTFDTIPWALPLVLVFLALALGFGLFDLLLRPREYAAPFLEAWSIRLLALALLTWLFLLGLPWAAAKLLTDATPTIGSRGSAPGWLAGSAAASTLVTGVLALLRVSGPKGAAPGASGVDVSALWKKVVSGAKKAGDGILRLLFIIVGGVIGPLAFLAGFLMLAMGAMASGIGPRQLFWWLLLVSTLPVRAGRRRRQPLVVPAVLQAAAPERLHPPAHLHRRCAGRRGGLLPGPAALHEPAGRSCPGGRGRGQPRGVRPAAARSAGVVVHLLPRARRRRHPRRRAHPGVRHPARSPVPAGLHGPRGPGGVGRRLLAGHGEDDQVRRPLRLRPAEPPPGRLVAEPGQGRGMGPGPARSALRRPSPTPPRWTLRRRLWTRPGRRRPTPGESP